MNLPSNLDYTLLPITENQYISYIKKTFKELNPKLIELVIKNPSAKSHIKIKIYRWRLKNCRIRNSKPIIKFSFTISINNSLYYIKLNNHSFNVYFDEDIKYNVDFLLLNSTAEIAGFINNYNVLDRAKLLLE